MQFLFVDKITKSSPGEWIQGIKTITEDSFYLTRDEESGCSFFYPSLVGEALGQLAAWNVMAYRHFTVRPVAGVVGQAYFHRPAYVGELLRMEAFIDALDETTVRYHGHVYIEDELIFTLEDALGPLLPMSLFIEDSTVRHQYDAILAAKKISEAPASKCSLQDTVVNLSFDKIIAFEKESSIRAEKRILSTAPYFPDHFPKKPVLPMTILLESILLLARDFMRLSGWGETHVIACRKIKMNEFVSPESVLQCSLHVKTITSETTVLAARGEVDGKRVAVLDIVMKKGAKGE